MSELINEWIESCRNPTFKPDRFQLKCFLQELNKNTNEWVSVDVALPEIDTLVLVDGGVATWSGREWFSQTRCENRQIIWTVTHWKPLPEPPNA